MTDYSRDPSQVLIEREDGCHQFNTPPLDHLRKAVDAVLTDEVIQMMIAMIPAERPDTFKVASSLEFLMEQLTTTEFVVLHRIMNACINAANEQMMTDIVNILSGDSDDAPSA